MDINNIFGMHEMALQVHVKRAQVLASNLANADTPGYKAKDIDFRGMLESLKDEDKYSLSNLNEILEHHVVETPSMNASMDKNTVDTHIEKGKMAQNSIHYMASLRFVEARLKGLMTVIKGE